VEQGEERVIELIGYRYTPKAYERVQPDDRGWIWLQPMQLWLGLTLDRMGNYQRLACFEPTTGAEVGDYTAISTALAAKAKAFAEAETRALAESVARAEAETRALAESVALGSVNWKSNCDNVESSGHHRTFVVMVSPCPCRINP
jgi:hypothetical protein